MGIIIILLLFIVLPLLWPKISPYINRWIQRFMARRAEDMMRRMAGMPSRKEEERRAREREKRSRRERSSNNSRRSKSATQSAGDMHRSMQEYAEDVEYVEIKEFHSTTISEETVGSGPHKKRVVVESQVSDAEYTIIRS